MKWLIIVLGLCSMTPLCHAAEFIHPNVDDLHLATDGSSVVSWNFVKGSSLLRGWDLRTRKPLNLKFFSRIKRRFYVVAVSGNNRNFLISTAINEDISRNCIVALGKGGSGHIAELTSWGQREVMASAARDNRIILVGPDRIHFYSLRGRLLKEVRLKRNLERRDVILSGNGRWLAVGGEGYREIIDTYTGRSIRRLEPDSKQELPVDTWFSFSKVTDDGRYVAGDYLYVQLDGYDHIHEEPYTLAGQHVWDTVTGKIVLRETVISDFWGNRYCSIGGNIFDLVTKRKIARLTSKSWDRKTNFLGFQVVTKNRIWAAMVRPNKVVTETLKVEHTLGERDPLIEGG